ncbi:cell division protein FtsB [Desulfitispora alkaliphila]|uniref:FtsB family cell division protein n=1 Tax=Desulfitispora alkaliphila TaxID=622674 RepID=UPI003D1A3C5D
MRKRDMHDNIAYLPTAKNQKKKKNKITWKFKWKPVMILALVGYIVFFAYNQQAQLATLNNEKEILEVQKAKLLEEQSELKAQKELVHQPEFIEQKAREELGLVKPGEKLVIIN